MVDSQSGKGHLESNNLSYYTFYLKSERPIKAVIRHLPMNTPAKEIAEGLVDLGFEIISVEQMSTTRRSPEGTTSITLPLFLITLPRIRKSQDFFKLSTSATFPSRYSHTNPKTPSRNVTTARSLTTSGLIANNLPAACGVGVATNTKIARKKGTQHQHKHAATASWLKKRQHIPPTGTPNNTKGRVF
jgi:hypothetical protein